MMCTTISVDDFDSCCRCCLEKIGTMTPIFIGCLNGMFNDVMRLQLAQDDGYPQQMCSRCIIKLSSAHTFYHMVLNSQKTLEVALKEAASQTSKEFETTDSIELEEIDSKELVPKLNMEVEETTQLILTSSSGSIECKAEKLEPNIMPSNRAVISYKAEPSNSEDTYHCQQCDHRTSTQEDLTTHLEEQLDSKDAVPKVLSKTSHLCSHCGKGYRQRSSLAKHMRLHRGNYYQCRYCDKRFTEATTLKVHLVTHNLVNTKPFRCSVCQKCFTQKSSLNKHLRGHNLSARHRCPHCEKSFRQSCSVQRHCTRQHDTIQCDSCSKYFVGKKALEVHMKSHMPSKLSHKRKTIIKQTAAKTIDQVDVESVRVEFLCMLCLQKFQSKESLESHLCTRENVTWPQLKLICNYNK